MLNRNLANLFSPLWMLFSIVFVETAIFLVVYWVGDGETLLIAYAIPLSLLLLLFLWKFFEVSFVLFLTILFGLYDIFGKFPLLSSPVNIYLGDGILIFIVVLIIKLLVLKKLSLLKSPISRLLVINFAVGLGFLAIAHIFFDISLNNMLGAFRRYYVYPLSAFVAIYYVNTEKNGFSKLKTPFVLILTFIITLVVFRIALNKSWWGDYYGAAGDSRAIGYFTGIILLMGFTFSFGYSIFRNSLKFYLVAGVFFCSVLVANWRMLWFFAALLPFFVAYLVLQRRSASFARLLIALLTMAGLTGLLFYVISVFTPGVYDLLVNKMITKVIQLDFSTDARYWAWQSAISKFSKSPLWGYGLGMEFNFWGINSLGQYVIFDLGTHNIIFDLLYQVGLLGVWPFVLFHLFVVVYTVKKLFSFSVIQRLIIATLFTGYFVELSVSMVQSALRVPTDVVAFYLIVGFLVQYIKKTSLSPTKHVETL